MKNVIKYYYNLDVSSIRQIDNNYYLIINNSNFLLCPCDISMLDKIIKYIENPYFNKLIYTVNQMPYININNKNYALFQVNTILKKIDLNDIVDFNFPIMLYKNIGNEWSLLWEEHIDYLEYKVNSEKNKYKLVNNVLYYYIGMAENALQILNNDNFNNISLYLSHRRLKNDSTLVDIYNPANIIIDSRVRDFAEYIKNVFFYSNNQIDTVNIFKYIDLLNESEKKLFFARLLYPTYFFDLCNEIFENNKKEDILNQIIAKTFRYESFLLLILNYIKKTTYINIDWLN